MTVKDQNDKPKNIGTLVDITAPDIVQIQIRKDAKVIWVNIDGICVLRACRIKHLIVENDMLSMRIENDLK